jgi:hypothetical protein
MSFRLFCFHYFANLINYAGCQNSRNNSMGQCQLVLENYEKNNKLILYLLDLKIWGLRSHLF